MELQQQSTEWLAWRAKGLGSSDCPVILGVSPWRTPYELWLEKTQPGKGGPTTPNWQQQRGINLEPVARARYEFQMGYSVQPVLMEHPEFPYFRVSLDGWNDERKIVWECKVPGKDDHQKAKNGEVPEKYIWQLEMQLWVSGGVEAHYFSYQENKGKVDTALVIYKSIPERREKMIKALHEFWNCVQTNTPPPLCDRDTMVLEDIKSKAIFSDLEKALQEREELKAKIDLIEAKIDAMKEKAIEIMPHSSVQCGRVKLKKVVTKGRVDYSKIDVLSNIDIEQYRGPESVSHRLELVG